MYLPPEQMNDLGDKITGFYCKQKRGRVPARGEVSRTGLSGSGVQKVTRSLARTGHTRSRRIEKDHFRLPPLPDLTIVSLGKRWLRHIAVAPVE